ncbi:hypothetical protein Henu6_gp167 [Acinetobacter phage Henu6]|uniref:Uncharacterized protein n=2 Tax=Caudoviricetes TaxID=2731619 RepID=A0A410T5G2_9CAUD|nr:hypothetical protein Henu6_gp167 [Acinetobacter phage Henu6]
MKVYTDKLSHKPNGSYGLYGTRLTTKGFWIFKKTVTEQYKLGSVTLVGKPGNRCLWLHAPSGECIFQASIDICNNIIDIESMRVSSKPDGDPSWGPLDQEDYLKAYRQLRDILCATDYIQ